MQPVNKVMPGDKEKQEDCKDLVKRMKQEKKAREKKLEEQRKKQEEKMNIEVEKRKQLE